MEIFFDTRNTRVDIMEIFIDIIQFLNSFSVCSEGKFMFNCQFQPSLYFCRNRFSSFLGLAQAAPSVSRPPLSPPSWETTGTGRPTLKSTTRHVPYIYSSWKINELRPYKSSKAPYTLHFTLNTVAERLNTPRPYKSSKSLTDLW